MDQGEFKTSLGHIVNFRVAKKIVKSCLKKTDFKKIIFLFFEVLYVHLLFICSQGQHFKIYLLRLHDTFLKK